MGISSPGVGSNLDVNSIVTQLMSVEQKPLTALATKQASYTAKLSAIGSIKGALGSFQTAVQGLSTASRFQTMLASSSDSSSVGAATGKGAVAGSYSVEVTQLAQGQKLASAGFADTTTQLGGGTLVFDFGTIANGALGADGKYTGASFASNGAGVKTLVIDPAKSSLGDIRDAINKGGLGISATIVNDGTATPNRLLLTNTKTGASNSLQVSVSNGSPLAAYFGQDPSKGPSAQSFSETSTAQNAVLKVDGITVTKQSNVVDDVIPGVTMSLNKTNVGSKANINVTQDTAGVQAAVGQFVTAYNQINKTLSDASSYNAATKQAGPLNGDPSVRSIQNAIKSVLNAPVVGNDSMLSTLPQIGVTLQKDGTMSLDNAKLSNVLSTDFTHIAGIFAASGSADDTAVSFVTSGAKTKPDTYALNITNIAAKASIGSKVAAILDFTGGSGALTVKLNGIAIDLNLKTDTPYTSADALASDIQSKVNGSSSLAALGYKLVVNNNSGVLSFTSDLFGSKSSLEITGTASAAILGVNPKVVAGADVQGTIGGASAVGEGQNLKAAVGSAAEGMMVSITGGLPGARGNIHFSKGYAYQFSDLMTNMLSEKGAVASKVTGLNATLKSLDADRTRISDRLAATEARYRAQFTALDRSISSMNSTSTYLAQQLTALAKSIE